MNQFAAEPRTSAETRRWVLFAAVSVLFGLSMFYRSAIAVLTTDLIRDVPMDMGTLGLVSAAFFYTYGLFQIPGGLLLVQKHGGDACKALPVRGIVAPAFLVRRQVVVGKGDPALPACLRKLRQVRGN